MTRLLRWLRTGQWTPPTHEPVELNGSQWCVHDGGAVPWPCAEVHGE